MFNSTAHDPTVRVIRCAVVLRVREDACEVLRDGRLQTARFAAMFPSPRTERVQPGNLVAMTAGSDGVETVLWRWYDAVVLDEGSQGIRLWEPAHGEVLAQARPAYLPGRRGARAYLSAGLPGADWWVAGPAEPDARDADVELGEVDRLFTENGLWDSVAG
jgi:hypothetical protein